MLFMLARCDAPDKRSSEITQTKMLCDDSGIGSSILSIPHLCPSAIWIAQTFSDPVVLQSAIVRNTIKCLLLSSLSDLPSPHQITFVQYHCSGTPISGESGGYLRYKKDEIPMFTTAIVMNMNARYALSLRTLSNLAPDAISKAHAMKSTITSSPI